MESVGNLIVYAVIAIAIIVFSVLTVTTRKILRSATYLLFVFAIMLTHQPGRDAQLLESRRRWLGILAAVLGVAVCAYALFSHSAMCAATLGQIPDFDIAQLGHWLLSTDKYGYLLPFEAISILLLACIIGGVVIARRR